MKQVLVKGGNVIVEDVPAPGVSAKSMLVRVEYSCLSSGTELAGLRMSGLPLYRRALKQPHHVKKVLELARDQGLKRTVERVLGTLAFGTPTGYSAAGRVIAVGSEVEGFAVGDRVACAGAGIANHAEVIDVPVNLAARVPPSLDLSIASTVTLGAIALQGVRRCAPTLGETIIVVGLGILGQMTAQMLTANGCQVVGIDPDEKRLALARANGMAFGFSSDDDGYMAAVQRLTDGAGADATIITAASSSDEIVSRAAQCCRRKGRVVLVGDVGLGLKREDFYAKELDFLISTSYGPGRYDPVYEEGGQDYPLAYVRWTENRNMEAYLQLLAQGSVRLQNLLGSTFAIGDAVKAYDSLRSGSSSGVVSLLHYPNDERATLRNVSIKQATTARSGEVRVAVLGPGGFAQAVHLPNIVALKKRFSLQAIGGRTGVNAKGAATRFGANYATTDLPALLADSSVDAVIICTRHDVHSDLALKALAAGKHVLVEKPLATTEAQLETIESHFAELGDRPSPLLLTGFNRRFSPAARRAKDLLGARTGPMIVNYVMNAGYIPLNHWVHSMEGGGRNIGEACHIYDLFNYFTDAEPVRVSATSIASATKHYARNDNFVATICYADGSVCTLTYTALGNKAFPKEQMEIFADGMVIELDDFKSLNVFGSKKRGWESRTIQKGQLEELVAFADGIETGQWPITLREQVAATRVSFLVERQIRSGPGDHTCVV